MASSSSSLAMDKDSTASQHLHIIMPDLPYEDKNIVSKHLTEALLLYPEIQHPKVETNLLKLSGPVDYPFLGNKCRDFVKIYLSPSYPKDTPQVWIDCQYGSAINPDHRNIAPNGLVLTPYLAHWDGDKCSLVSLISHLKVEFSRQPPTFVIDVGITLSPQQMGLVKIILDFQIMHLYYGICKLTSKKTSDFFQEVTGRYPKDVADLVDHIRTSKGGVKNYINTVAEILGLPAKTRFTVDVADLHFLP